LFLLAFQTTSPEGVLFYGRRQYPHYSHLAVSLSNATLHVSAVLARSPASSSELYVTLGNALDDDRCPTRRMLVALSVVHSCDCDVTASATTVQRHATTCHFVFTIVTATVTQLRCDCDQK